MEWQLSRFFGVPIAWIFLLIETRFLANKGVVNSVADKRRQQRTKLAFRYFAWKKFFNLIRIELALRTGEPRIGGTAYEWEIDTTNICQLKCPLCHTGLGTVNRDKGIMHIDLYKQTIDQIKDYAIWLTLYSWGEPFLNKRIHEFIGYAHDNNIATITSTNLNKPLTADEADSVINAGLDVMIISLDGTTQEVYEQYRVGGHLDRVLDNIRLFVERKKALGSQTPYLEWQFIVMRQNEHQMEDAEKMADELGVDSIIFKRVDFPWGEDRPEVAEKWLPRRSEYINENPLDRPYKESGSRCWRLWRTSVVNWDGGLAPCCYMTDAADDFGDVKTTPIQEIKNNEKYMAARGLFDAKFTPTTYVGCQDCPVYLETPAGQGRGVIDIPRPQPVLSSVKVQLNGMNGNGSGSRAAGKIIANGSKIVAISNGTGEPQAEPVGVETRLEE